MTMDEISRLLMQGVGWSCIYACHWCICAQCHGRADTSAGAVEAEAEKKRPVKVGIVAFVALVPVGREVERYVLDEAEAVVSVQL